VLAGTPPGAGRNSRELLPALAELAADRRWMHEGRRRGDSRPTKAPMNKLQPGCPEGSGTLIAERGRVVGPGATRSVTEGHAANGVHDGDQHRAIWSHFHGGAKPPCRSPRRTPPIRATRIGTKLGRCQHRGALRGNRSARAIATGRHADVAMVAATAFVYRCLRQGPSG